MAEFILFDLDGTLTDSKEGIVNCVSYALNHFNIEHSLSELEIFVGPPLKEQFMSFAKLSEKDAEEAVRVYRERFAPIGIFENKVYDGVLDMLSKLKKDGKTLVIATSKPHVFAQRIADKYGIAPFISHLEGSELDGRNTDKAEVIKNAMATLGASPEDTVMVGDRMHDCIGAIKNGIEFVGVSYGYARDNELEESGAKIIASSPQSLYEILSTM